jgi:hypothetical protein
MSLCGFGQFGDWRIASLCCYGRLIIDRSCNLSVPTATIDSNLIVDIGGHVEMPMTTINFQNSTIDFSGSSIKGFTGNIDGNITVDSVVANVGYLKTIFANKIYANVCGNFIGQVYGTTFGNACLNNLIVDKVTGKDGNVYINSPISKVCTPNLFVDYINPKNQGNVNVVGTLNVSGNIIGVNVYGNLQGTLFGNFCGNVFTDTIKEKILGHGVTFGSNVIVGNLNVTQNLNASSFTIENGCIPTLYTDTIIKKGGVGFITFLNDINVFGTVTSIFTNTTQVINSSGISPLVISSPFSPIVVTGNIFFPPPYYFDSSVGNITTIYTTQIHPKIPGQYITTGNIKTVDICANILHIDTIVPKHFSYISLGDSIVGNLIVTDNFTPNVGMLMHVDIAANLVQANYIASDTPGGLIYVLNNTIFNNNLVVNGTILVNNITPNTGGNVAIHGNLIVDNYIYGKFKNIYGNLCGNAYVYNIVAKKTNGNIDVYGNIVLHSSFFGSLVGPTVKITSLTSGRVPIISTGGLISDSSTLTFASGLLTTQTLNVTGLTGTSATSGRVPYKNSTQLTDSASFTYNTTSGITLSGSNGLNISGSGSLISSGFTNKGVLFANSAQSITQDASNFTYDSTTGLLKSKSLVLSSTFPGSFTVTLPGVPVGTSGVLYLSGTSVEVDTSALNSPFRYSSGTSTLTVPMISATSISCTGAITSTASSITAATSITATAGDITASSGNVIISAHGKGIQIQGGTNTTDNIGSVTLSSGSVSVTRTSLTSSDIIFVSRANKNGSSALGHLEAKITAGVGFIVTSYTSASATETNDNSIVNFVIIRQI